MLDDGIEERSFADWSMGFKQISNKDWSELNGYFNIENDKKLSQITNSHVVSMITSFSNVNRLRM